MPAFEAQLITKESFQNLLDWAVPEPARYIRDRLSRVTFFLNQDQKGVLLKTGEGKIHFTLKDLRQLWLIGFVSWKAIPCYTPIIIGAHWLNQPLGPSLIARDKDLVTLEQDFDNLRYNAKQLLIAQNRDDVPWPASVPASMAELKNTQDLAAANLICMATAALLLHELRHDEFEQNQKNHIAMRPEMRDEERQCDAFARQCLLADVSSYVASSGEPFELVLHKRASALALAAYAVYEITPSYAHAGWDSHPAVADRLDELIRNSNIPDADYLNGGYFWVYASALLMATLRASNRLTTDVAFDDPKDLCMKLLGLIREATV